MSHLTKALEDQLKLSGFEYDCNCPWCEVLHPLATAHNQDQAEAAEADYRVFCAEAQAKGEAQERARQMVESGGALAQARYLHGGRIALWVEGVHVQTFDSAWRFFEFCENHTITIKVKTEK